ncbi:hypothetical protein [Haloparvum sp. PAK95]|uniref:hypothetical protein n=1 Tax=Haloparvum sp. PAK95 TaxID=3418962 RepID=UPI003D2EE9CB
MDWQARAGELLFDGESIRERIDAGGDRVVVTTHRVLAFTPGSDGANFRAIDRPNVTGVRAGTRGNADQLRGAGVAGAGGLGALALGLLLDLDSLVPKGGVDLAGGSAAGIGGLLATIETLLRIVALLDDLLVFLGVVALLAAAVLVGVYWTRREPVLTIAVAGDDDVQVGWAAGDDDVQVGWAAGDERNEEEVDDADSAEAAANRLRRAVYS